jgi:hypothetical protein
MQTDGKTTVVSLDLGYSMSLMQSLLKLGIKFESSEEGSRQLA